MATFNRAKRGFKQFEKEEQERERDRAKSRNQIYGMFLKEGDKDIPVRFLTEEPILAHIHSIPAGRGFDDIPCTGAGCEYCAEGDRAKSVGAWLVVDERPWERKVREAGRETGEVEEVPFNVRILKRGPNDIGVYHQKNSKFPLTEYTWEMSRLGKESSTTYAIERIDHAPLDDEDIMEYLQTIPPALRAYVEENGTDQDTLMDLVEFSLLGEPQTVAEFVEEFAAKRDKERASSASSSPARKTFGKRGAPASASTSKGIKKPLRKDPVESGVVDLDEEEEAPKKRKPIRPRFKK